MPGYILLLHPACKSSIGDTTLPGLFFDSFSYPLAEQEHQPIQPNKNIINATTTHKA